MDAYSSRDNLYAIEMDHRAAFQLQNPSSITPLSYYLVLLQHIATDTYIKQ